MYMNQIYFGQGAYGVETAANTYFGKHVKIWIWPRVP